MPYRKASTIGYAYTPTLKALRLWLDFAMEKTLEGRLAPLSEALSNTLPSLVESMRAIVASTDSTVTVKEKLEAAEIISRINGRVADKETSKRVAAEKKAVLAQRSAHVKSIDKRHTAAERKRISKALDQHVKEMRGGTA
jgi:hypothetical protein